MANKKIEKRVLVKVNNSKDAELDKALDDALDALFGPEEKEEKKPTVSKKSTKRTKSVNSGKEKQK